jgi:hypothetical protein
MPISQGAESGGKKEGTGVICAGPFYISRLIDAGINSLDK